MASQDTLYFLVYKVVPDPYVLRTGKCQSLRPTCQYLCHFPREQISATLPWCSCGLLLEVALQNLLNLDNALLLASRCLDAVQGVGRLDEHSLVDDDVLLVPLCGKSATLSVQSLCLSE